MIKSKVTVLNDAGLHARPASELVKLASRYSSDFFIHLDGYRVNGKSILGVLTLAAEKGTELELEFNGNDEEPALNAVSELFENKFNVVKKN